MKLYLDNWRTYPNTCSVNNEDVWLGDSFSLNDLLDIQYEFILVSYPHEPKSICVYKNEEVVAEFPVPKIIIEDRETYYGVSFVDHDMCYQLRFKEVLPISTIGEESCNAIPNTIDELINPTQALKNLIQKGKGYHLDSIEKGINGESSKIQEELDELKDAEKQGVKVMQLVELSDLIGSIELYLEKHFPSVTLDDLIKMKDVTKRAFINGKRV